MNPKAVPSAQNSQSLKNGSTRASWQDELSNSFTTVEDLTQEGIVSPEEALKLHSIGERFRVRVPRYYAALIDRTDLENCPIRKQAIPALGEEDPVLPKWAQDWSALAFGKPEPWHADAIGDLAKLAAPRLTHRYGNRAILHLSSLCALYCRFCFRKSHLNDSERTLYDGSLEPALDYLSKTPEIRELILTGGDPLSLPDGWLEKFLKQLEGIAHLRQLRVHSRMAVTLPSRFTPALAELLSSRKFNVALVSHFNHPRELTSFALKQLQALRSFGVSLYNQSVLLAGVNDNVETLVTLFQSLYENGVTPFYLHHPDWTPGTFHFRLPIERGQKLMQKLAGRISGPALPHYVLDMPGGTGKIALSSPQVQRVNQKEENGLGGALWRVIPPSTRETPEPARERLFAEFWKN